MTKLCNFKRDNPPVLTWLKILSRHNKPITNCTNKFFLQPSTTNCAFNVTLSVQSVQY